RWAFTIRTFFSSVLNSVVAQRPYVASWRLSVPPSDEPPIFQSTIVACAPETAAKSDRKSTRLNSSHLVISYAVFCLKKKNEPIGRVPLPLLAAVLRAEPAA